MKESTYLSMRTMGNKIARLVLLGCVLYTAYSGAKYFGIIGSASDSNAKGNPTKIEDTIEGEQDKNKTKSFPGPEEWKRENKYETNFLDDFFDTVGDEMGRSIDRAQKNAGNYLKRKADETIEPFTKPLSVWYTLRT
mgnify:FL=1